MRFYFPIAKVDAEQRTVWGYASTEALDDQGEIVTREALAAALDDYMRFANIREMHQPSAVGVATEAAVDEKGLYVAARIVDDAAWVKVQEGVYKGFSIGGRVKRRDPADRKIITGLALTEISVVDRPANPEAVFDCWKANAAAGDEAADSVAEFADPGYRDDGEKRYPLDTEEHIRAAWAYIHVPRNAAKYTPEQAGRIKARIVAAWKERIDPQGPPEAERKASQGGALRKSLGELAPLIEKLCGLLKFVAAEEGTRLGAGIAAIAKAGAAAEGPEDLAKLRADNAALSKAVAEFGPRLNRLAQRVEEIAQMPLPPLTLAHGATALSKSADGRMSDADIVAALAGMSGEERTLALIKAAHTTPIRAPAFGPAAVPRDNGG